MGNPAKVDNLDRLRCAVRGVCIVIDTTSPTDLRRLIHAWWSAGAWAALRDVGLR